MKRYAILLLAVVVLSAGLFESGCDFMKKEKIKSLKQWHQARARIICSVGEEHIKGGSLDKAQSCAMESLGMDGDYLPARILLAKVLLGKGRYDQADEHLQKAEALSMTMQKDSSNAPPRGAEIAYLRGEAAERTSRYPEALACYQKARALDPSNDSYLMASAEVLVSMGKPKGALELLEIRLQRIGTENEPSVLILAGEVAMLTGNYAKAVDFFQQYLDMKQSDNPQKSQRSIRKSLAKAHFFAGNYRQAIESLRLISDSTTSRSPDKPASTSCWVYIMIGDSYMALNRSREAKVAYESAIKIEPSEPKIWLSLTKACVACGDGRRGIVAGLRAMELTDNHTGSQGAADRMEISIATACAMLKEKRPADAMRVLATSAREHPNDPMLWCMLGRCYSAQGRSDRAAACYMAALRSDPKHKLAKTLMTSTLGSKLRTSNP
ncbi:MAG: tetratricopeptide repeat protein [Phycisphaerae bacterium]|nr:tetratricopeptide repeat protein [Phycisphaerae bacterium]